MWEDKAFLGNVLTSLVLTSLSVARWVARCSWR